MTARTAAEPNETMARALRSDTPEFAVEIRGLEKVYRAGGRGEARHALRNVDLTIPSGSLFGLLGPNGAGKSTMINILAGLVLKTAGSARIWGFDLDRRTRAARRAIGVVPQELNIDPFFTPRELLDLQAGLYGVPKAERATMSLLDTVGLADRANAYARTLSGGMRRRLMVAKAMVHNPPVLVLDEPTAGVDIELRRQLWANVRALNGAGTTVLLTTHYLEEAEELCDRIAIINHGRVIACDTTEALVQRLDAKEMAVWVAEPLDVLPESLAALGMELRDAKADGQGDTPPGAGLLFHYRRGQHRVGDILNAIGDAGLSITDVSTKESDLEDAFLALTRSDDEAEARA